MIILLLFAFISGLVTILAPCIWPLLPIILSSTAVGGRGKPLGVAAGISLSFGVFTLTVSYLVRLLNFDPDILRLFAVIVIGVLGLSLIIPKFSATLEVWVSKLSGRLNLGTAQKGGFLGGLITGIALGIVWSPCAGPILATIATLASTRAVNWQVVLVTFVYVTGVGIPLFVFSKLGRLFFERTRGVNKYTGRIQQVFGVVMIVTALLIFTGYDKVLSAKLLDSVPSYSAFLTNLESNPEVQKGLNNIKGQGNVRNGIVGKPMNSVQTTALPDFGPAPEFTGISKWLNTNKPLTMAGLRGKVVLVDFWTYTCINCIRTLPYVTSWYNKYHDQGFIVVGVHTPEFEFEKKTENVQMGISEYGIKYPVAQDNDYATWNAYSNNSWPAEYLVDANGHVRKVDIGEGGYAEMEMVIQNLLLEAGKTTDSKIVAEQIIDQTPTRAITPETYIGLRRQAAFNSPEIPKAGVQKYSLPQNIPFDSFAVSGEWNFTDDSATAGNNSTLVLHFNANKVYLVAGPGGKNDQIKESLDGHQASGQEAGKDVKDGVVTVDRQDTYNIVDLRGQIGDHILKLEITPGTVVYVFTFG